MIQRRIANIIVCQFNITERTYTTAKMLLNCATTTTFAPVQMECKSLNSDSQLGFRGTRGCHQLLQFLDLYSFFITMGATKYRVNLVRVMQTKKRLRNTGVHLSKSSPHCFDKTE